MPERRKVFVTGGTGYMGQRMIAILLARGHSVTAVARENSRGKLPRGCSTVEGNALDHRSYVSQIAPADTFVHLVGIAHPSPAKAQQFREIDFVSAVEAFQAAKTAAIQHFVYVSVAHPAPAMKAYVAVRSECEQKLQESGLNGTVLRPWYVLGPGHRWPYLLLPMYWICERLPWTREGARRLGLVTLPQMVSALVSAVESPHQGWHVIEVPEIRQASTSVMQHAARA